MTGSKRVIRVGGRNKPKTAPEQSAQTLPDADLLKELGLDQIEPPKKVSIVPNKMAKHLDRDRQLIPEADQDRQVSTEDIDDMLADEGVPKTNSPRVYNKRPTTEDLEYTRKQIHRLLLRGIPKKTIAEYLEIPISSLYRHIKEINERLRAEVQDMDFPLLIGQTLSFFDEVRNVALRVGTDTKEKSNMVKMRALEVALRAETSKHDYLSTVGLYNLPTPIKTSDMGSSQTDADDFLNLLHSATKGVTIVDGVVQVADGEVTVITE